MIRVPTTFSLRTNSRFSANRTDLDEPGKLYPPGTVHDEKNKEGNVILRNL